MRAPTLKQVTLVSLYGQKRESLARLIQRCSDIILRSPLSRIYKPYHIDQIHGTIIGMEKLSGYEEHFNAKIWADTETKTIMDFTQLLPSLQRHLPMTIQFGGFPQSFTEFKSSELSPYERSFQIQWKTGRFTLIGWPHKDGDFTSHRLLNELRDEIDNKCNVRHKYRGDNDLFMVLGEIVIPDSIKEDELVQLREISSSVETEVREYLVNNKIDVTVDAGAVSLAQYEVETLALESTVFHRITKAGINADFIGSLYK